MAACTDGTSLSVKLDKKELRKHLGFYRGTMAGIFLKKEFETPFVHPSPGVGSIEFVGTAAELQGASREQKAQKMRIGVLVVF